MNAVTWNQDASFMCPDGVQLTFTVDGVPTQLLLLVGPHIPGGAVFVAATYPNGVCSDYAKTAEALLRLFARVGSRTPGAVDDLNALLAKYGSTPLEATP